MPAHLKKEIEKLKAKILSLSEMVVEDVRCAMKAVANLDVGLARRIVEEDIEIDRFEVEIEEDCLKVLALHQPVAIDLRFIIAVLKINNDLERIADLAVNIAERVEIISDKIKIAPAPRFSEMIEKTQEMMRKSLRALVNMDAALAREVMADDDIVDDINREIYDWVKDKIVESPDRITVYITHLSISRYLERIADSTTNIAEDVIYMIEGDIVRHAAGMSNSK